MTRGYDLPLYVLPFDHRASFETGMFGWKGELTPEQTAQIAEAKRVIYDGFKAAVACWSAEAESSYPGGRAIRGSHSARCQGGRLYDRVSGREKRTG